MNTYKNLEAWKKSLVLVKMVYEISKSFPKEEIYGIASQIKRAAVSIPTNIAEGCGRQYKRDTRQFLYIARGSLYEVDSILTIAVMTNMLAVEKMEELAPLIEENLKIIHGLINHYEKAELR